MTQQSHPQPDAAQAPYPTTPPPAQAPTGAPWSPGAPWTPGAAAAPRRLVRRRDDKMIAGVCSGVAAYTGLDVTLVRLLTVVLTILGLGTIVVAYIVAWILVPQE